MVDDPSQVTVDQMEAWVVDFDSWDLCDQVCGNLFTETPHSFDRRARLGAARRGVREAGGFLDRGRARAVRDRRSRRRLLARDGSPRSERGAVDERNYVKKAVNWALRQIGKRDLALNTAAIDRANGWRPHRADSARWIARDALRELRSDGVQARVRARAPR